MLHVRTSTMNTAELQDQPDQRKRFQLNYSLIIVPSQLMIVGDDNEPISFDLQITDPDHYENNMRNADGDVYSDGFRLDADGRINLALSRVKRTSLFHHATRYSPNFRFPRLPKVYHITDAVG